MAALHGQLKLPFRTVLYTWLRTRRHLSQHGHRLRVVFGFVPPQARTWYTLALGRHRNCLRAVDVFDTPPASQALAQSSFCALKSLPIPMITISQDIKDFTTRELQVFSPLPTFSVALRSSLYVHVHHSDFSLGSISRSDYSSMMSFTYQSLFVVAK